MVTDDGIARGEAGDIARKWPRWSLWQRLADLGTHRGAGQATGRRGRTPEWWCPRLTGGVWLRRRAPRRYRVPRRKIVGALRASARALPPDQEETMIPAVPYRAKSTEDKHGSLQTQQENCRAMAKSEGRTLVEEELHGRVHGRGHQRVQPQPWPRARTSAWSGLLLLQRSTVAVCLWRSTAIASPVALAAPGAADHLAEILFWTASPQGGDAVYQDDSPSRNPLLTVAIGERNAEDSSRKAKATRDGLRRRKQRGAPVGALPLGYCAQRLLPEDEKTRVVDEVESGRVLRLFTLLAEGYTPARSRACSTAPESGRSAARPGQHAECASSRE